MIYVGLQPSVSRCAGTSGRVCGPVLRYCVGDALNACREVTVGTKLRDV